MGVSSIVSGCPPPTPPPPVGLPPPTPPAEVPLGNAALLVVGGTKNDNSSTNAVELLQLDGGPIKCTPKSFPTEIDRAVGVNFLPIHGHRCTCIVPPYYKEKEKYVQKYPEKQPNRKPCCCKGESGVPRMSSPG